LQGTVDEFQVIQTCGDFLVALGFGLLGGLSQLSLRGWVKQGASKAQGQHQYKTVTHWDTSSHNG